MSIFHKKQLVTIDRPPENLWTVDTLREYLLTLIAANEVKYSERFEASQSAVNRAFEAQKTAMETALIAQKLAVDTALGAADRAVAKAETAAEKRFEAVNEFRKTLSDQQVTFATRNEVAALFKGVEDKITAAQETFTYKVDGLRVSIEKNADSYVRGENELRLALTQTLTLSTYELRHTELQRQVNDLRLTSSSLITNDTFDARLAEMQTQITSLRESRSETSGKSLGANALWGIIAGIIILIITIAGFVIALLPHIVTK